MQNLHQSKLDRDIFIPIDLQRYLLKVNILPPFQVIQNLTFDNQHCITQTG